MEFTYLEKSLSDDFCDKCVEMYEKHNIEYGHEGSTRGGVNKKIKDTRDLCITVNQKELPEELIALNDELYNKLTAALAVYVKSQNEKYDVKMLNYKQMVDTGFMMQKYKKNVGKYEYHNDFMFNDDINKPRLLTYLWYLNDISEGGETEFWQQVKIKPKKGNLLLFPSNWTYPHCGLMPISDDKYIITGWLCGSDVDSRES